MHDLCQAKWLPSLWHSPCCALQAKCDTASDTPIIFANRIHYNPWHLLAQHLMPIHAALLGLGLEQGDFRLVVVGELCCSMLPSGIRQALCTQQACHSKHTLQLCTETTAAAGSFCKGQSPCPGRCSYSVNSHAAQDILKPMALVYCS